MIAHTTETAMTIHESNKVLIDGAVFDGAYEGLIRRRTAAEWLRLYDHNIEAGIAIRRARDGENGVSFRAGDGVVWHLRRLEPDEA